MSGAGAGAVRYEPASFRDRQARVFTWKGEVYRALGPQAAASWDRLVKTRLFTDLVHEGKLVGTSAVDAWDPAAPLAEGWTRVLHHARIPFISYPYEWSFSMLKDAALLQLEIQQRALAEDMTLKDASAFNVQFERGRPVFIDVGSFEPLAPNAPWAGYRQFCRTFLFPLLLQAYRGVPFQPWLRGSLEGIAAADLSRVLSLRDRLRPGVLTHVVLQSALERRFGETPRDVRRDLSEAGFDAGLIRRNVASLVRLVERLKTPDAPSGWTSYAETNSYTDADQATKSERVERWSAARAPRLVWDLGCNTGRFARIAAAHAETVVAMDADPAVVDLLHRALRAEAHSRVLPLVVNVADPSPALGWANGERPTLAARGRPDLTLCLALLHHLVISANVPLPEVVRYLADLGGALIVEFVSKEDPMAQRLLRNKADQYAEYTREVFEACLAERFAVRDTRPLASGTRFLYLAEPLER